MIVATLVLLVGCASDEVVEQVERPVDDLYNEALASALAGDTKAAAPQFEEVERQHPYSSLAVQAQIMAAWAFYRENDYPLMEFHPLDPSQSLMGSRGAEIWRVMLTYTCAAEMSP